MRYLRSSCDFKQHKPYKGFWKRRKENSERIRRFGKVGSQCANNWEKIKSGNGSSKLKRIYLYTIILVCLFFGWLILLIYLPNFRIKQITFYGLNIIKKGDIENDIRTNILDRNKFIPFSNYFLVRPKAVEKYINSKYRINSVSVTKKFPREMIVDIEEKVSSIIYDNGQTFQLLDQNGLVTKFLSSSIGPNEVGATSTTVILTTTSLGNGLQIKSHVPNMSGMGSEFNNFPVLFTNYTVSSTEMIMVKPEIISVVIDLFLALNKQGIVKVRYFTMDNPRAGIQVVSSNPWVLYFDLYSDVATQLERLNLLLKNSKPTEYVDLRSGERVFWK